MKIPTLPLLLLALVFSTFVRASTPDQSDHKILSQHISAIPDILYFNQDYTLDMSETKATLISSASVEGESADIDGNAIHIFIPYSNRETATRTIKVYSSNGQLIVNKTVAVIQKVKYNVSDCSDLFKLDEQLININHTIMPQDIKMVRSLQLNNERFNAPGLHIAGFFIHIASTNAVIYNEGGTFSEATRAALSALSIGDAVTIDKIRCTYQDGDQTVPLDINYTISLSLSTDM
jgi:hypothetical protein